MTQIRSRLGGLFVDESSVRTLSPKMNKDFIDLR